MNQSLAEFEALVARHQGAVCAVAYAVLRDRARSEEIAQEAFLVAWQKLPGMHPAPRMPGWVCGIARNLARNAARRRKEDEMTDDVMSDQRSPLDQLLSRESIEIARQALARLGDREREAVTLYYRGDESMGEVARALGISEQAAKKRVMRGRARLASAVGRVEATLRATRPGPAFTAACVAALAAGTATTAHADAARGSDATRGSSRAPRTSAGAVGAIAAATAAIAIVAGAWYAMSKDPPGPSRAAAPGVMAAGSAVAPGSSAIGAVDAVEVGAVPWRRISPAALAALTGRIRDERAARLARAASVGSGAAPSGAPEKVRVFDYAGDSLFADLPPVAKRAPGPLTKRDLRAAIQSVQPLLRECYESVAGRLARRDGTMIVVIRLEGEPEIGTIVSSARVGGDPQFASHAELVECVRETLYSIELPGLHDPGIVEVHYPLTVR